MPRSTTKTGSTRKRSSAPGTAAGTGSGGTSGSKRARMSITAGTSRAAAAAARVKADPDARPAIAGTTTASAADGNTGGSGTTGAGSANVNSTGNASNLDEEFIAMFSDPSLTTAAGSIPNTTLQSRFGQNLAQLANVINRLTSRGRLTMSRHSTTGELLYNLVSESQASKFEGLDMSARLVYQIIEKAGNLGIWTKDIRTQSNIQQLALNKVFKALEGRRLIKPTKSVTAKAKKLYMLYDVTPAKEITGGPWYTELEFDHEFISELRHFILHCVRRLNGGRGVSLREIMSKMKEANVSRVQLSIEEIRQLVQTLVYDYMVEETTLGRTVKDEGGGGDGKLYIAARRVSTMCDFKCK